MTATIIIAGAMILCIVLVVMALKHTAKKQANQQIKKLEDTLSTIVREASLSIHKKEVFRNRIIAIDMKSHKLLYAKIYNGDTSYDLIDLAQVKKCEAVKKTGYTGLCLEASNNVGFALVFYDDKTDDPMERQELEKKAIEWRDIISINRTNPNS